MTQTSVVLTAEMKTKIRAIRQQGGKIFLAIPEDMESGCTNCHGGGNMFLQTVVGGPFDSPMPGQGEGHGDEEKSSPINIYEQGAWYQVRTKGYSCPVCRGYRPDVQPRTADPARAQLLLDGAQKHLKAAGR